MNIYFVTTVTAEWKKEAQMGLTGQLWFPSTHASKKIQN